MKRVYTCVERMPNFILAKSTVSIGIVYAANKVSRWISSALVIFIVSNPFRFGRNTFGGLCSKVEQIVVVKHFCRFLVVLLPFETWYSNLVSALK